MQDNTITTKSSNSASADDLQFLEEQNGFGIRSSLEKQTSKHSLFSFSSHDETRGRRSVTISPPIPENAPVILSWSNLTVKTKTATPKVLLDDISGQITGGFWAIMGASGGGKTTLLSTLSLRLDPSKMEISGEVRLNGNTYAREHLKAMSAYVMQDDLLHAELTCEETLYYASQLRLPESFNDEQRKQRVDECVTLMGIDHCRKVIVGDTRNKGISGGERKRLCIAIELLSKPRLVFLDEPTSGLDSSTAYTVCKALQVLAESGSCTVICTIHQPQQKIFNLFDSLVLLKKGKIVYLGSQVKSTLFLESVGLPCPPDENPADHLLELISPNKETEDILNMERIANEKRSQVPLDLDMGIQKTFFNTQDRADFLRQFRIIAVRSFLQYTRHPDTILINFIATSLIASFIGGGIWYQQTMDQNTAKNTLVPSLFFTCVTQGIFGSLQVVNTFPSERAVMLRERASGAYFVSAYYLAKSMVDMLCQSWPPMLFSLIAYFMLGYTVNVGQFFIYMAFMVLDSLAATSAATAVSCWCVSIERSTVVLSFVFEVSRLYGGFFTSPHQLLDYPQWAWLDALSYIKYCFVGVALNELDGLQFSGCENGQPVGCIHNGNQIIAAKGYDQYTIGECVGILIFYIIGMRFLGYLALRFIKT